MKCKFLVKALCNGGLGLHPVSMFVEYDDCEPVQKFFDDARSMMFMAGYTSILHWESIDGCEYAKIIFDMQPCDNFVRKVLNLLEKRQYFVNMLDMIKQAKEGKEVEGVFCNSLGEWMANGGYSEDGIKKEIYLIQSTLRNYKECLSLLGVDVDDRKDMKRILTNLGFYRVELGNNTVRL